MIELMILGFLAEGPLHGYELRKKMDQLMGYARPISYGTIYPAIHRLTDKGLLTERTVPGSGVTQRKMLTLTDAGRERLEQMLREADGLTITDLNHFNVVLSFLSELPDEEERRAVLRRRLDFLEQPASFFYQGDRPIQSKAISDPYRRGVFVSAAAFRNAQIEWLHSMLDDGKPSDASAASDETEADA
ncbi:PadR family transcriptional regulator [Bifidobacterium lemurum]|nr:PadR family transcriptional regulator [Bifidobacterium lemurum]QOL34168.1 PadR family transcriptional regulator [Bifidobacterium lemurum]